MAKDREEDKSTRRIFDRTKAVMFFATPLRGILMEDIISILSPDSQGRANLIQSISTTSDTLKLQLSRFVDIAHRFKIANFYS